MHRQGGDIIHRITTPEYNTLVPAPLARDLPRPYAYSCARTSPPVATLPGRQPHVPVPERWIEQLESATRSDARLMLSQGELARCFSQ